MTHLTLIPTPSDLITPDPTFRLPVLITAAGPQAERRFLEFFTAQIPNTNTRAAYTRAAGGFFAFMSERGIPALAAIEPVHVAAWVQWLGQRYAVPSVKQQLAALRMLFDWLVIGQIVPANPAAAVRGPKHRVTRGKTPVLGPDDARALLESLPVDTAIGLRDRALIGVLIYSFARISAALAMTVADYYPQGRRMWLRLHEKGGRRHDMPCHHILEGYLDAYIEAAGIVGEAGGPLFRSAAHGIKSRPLGPSPLLRENAWAMIRRRAKAAGLRGAIGNHSFRATGITTYLENGGQLETARTMAAHASTKTTQLYDRRGDQVSLAEIERIRL